MPIAPDPNWPHRTVLLAPAVVALVIDPAGSYVDATFGRGGHARAILQRLSPQGRLLALDRDPDSAVAATAITDARFRFVSTRFSRLAGTLHERGMHAVQGILFDLGVSSPQIDDPARGFSLRGDGPLDMRMDPTQGASAAEWLAQVPLDELARVIRAYGEERFAVPIAKAIVARGEHGRDGGRRAGARAPIATTADLAAVVAAAVPRARRADPAQHPATRTFQAIRIYINQELEELALAIEQTVSLLAPGGRLVAISFHSLEDRIVKQFIDRHAHPERAFARLPLRDDQLPAPTLRVVAKVFADADEIAANPRARSAVMRVAERVGAEVAAADPVAAARSASDRSASGRRTADRFPSQRGAGAPRRGR